VVICMISGTVRPSALAVLRFMAKPSQAAQKRTFLKLARHRIALPKTSVCPRERRLTSDSSVLRYRQQLL
jgi:hypothetical protein